jgi:hypothetical protein
MKVLMPTKMKCAILCAFLLLEFVSRASAVLRPLFPFKPAPPSDGELAAIQDEAVSRSAKKPMLHQRGHAR